MKVLLFSCSTGGGHNSAAAALAQELEARNVENRTYDALQFLPKSTADLISHGHDFAYRYAPKLYGAGYLDILAAGGGILSTMRATQSASEEQLEAKASAALDEMLRFGTTTAEAKSGYGLSTGEECKALRVIGNLQKHHVMDLAATFMGAHAVPEAYRDNRQGSFKN